MTKLTLETFLSYCKENNLLDKGNQCVLAVSGGVDSMVMADLFIRAGIPVIIAHINHNLRQNDSDKDALLVQSFCKAHGIQFEVLTIPKGSLPKSNLQEEARNIRYQFLESIRLKYNCDLIATAHHNDDMVETFFINLLRGSGLKGLSSIQNRNNHIIRPLLFTGKTCIIEYATLHHVPFREDYTNDEDTYLRNRIRHHLIPLLNEISDVATTKITDSIRHLTDSNQLLDELSHHYESTFTAIEGKNLTIHLDKILHLKGHKTLLYSILNPLGFNESQIQQIISTSGTGAKTLAGEQILWRNRDQLIVQPKVDKTNIEINLTSLPVFLKINSGRLCFELTALMPDHNEKTTLYLDYEKIGQHAIVRKWKDGDRIATFGLKGKHQKVKDLLTNLKVPSHEKSDVLVIESNHIIAAVLPYKISEFFKCSENTRQVLRITLTN